MRIVAESILAEDGYVDFVGIEPDGRVTLVLVGEAGEDLELVARGLAQRAWVERRLGDWLQLAPDLGARPEAGIRVLLFCPAFGSQSRGAAAALGPDAPEFGIYRCFRNGSAIQILVENLGTQSREPQRPLPVQAEPPAAPPVFRTGLTDSDLGLSRDERTELEG